MTAPVNDLLTAIHARLTAEPGLAALLGDAIHDRRLNRTAMPYLVIGEAEARDYSTSTEPGLEVLLTVEAWSATSRREAEEVAAIVRASLEDAQLFLEDVQLISLSHQRTASRREAKTALFVAEMRFRAVLE